jgi:hypothetical protein
MKFSEATKQKKEVLFRCGYGKLSNLNLPFMQKRGANK